MKIFIDSADPKELEAAATMGLIDGVTTNPSLVAKTGMKFEALLQRICELIDGPISAEVVSIEARAMFEEGKKLASIHKNIVIKLPMTMDGLRACQRFSNEGIATNLTLCFTPIQAMMAAKAGATYVSPFVGRLDDIGQSGMQLIRDIRTVYQNYGFGTQILVASVRHVEHVLEAALIGGDVVTLPFKIFKDLLNHPLTEKGLEKFLSDWKASQK